MAAHGRHLHVDVHGVTDAGGARVEAVHVHVSLVERVEPRARRLLLLSAGDSGSTKRSSDVTYVMNESVRQRRHMLYSALPTHSTDAADADVIWDDMLCFALLWRRCRLLLPQQQQQL